jgi:LacI family transcriptional regulator
MGRQGSIVFLHDNVGTEYVSRIDDGGKRASRASQSAFQSVNLYGSGKSVADVIDELEPAAIVLTAPLCDDRMVLGQIERAHIPCVRIAPILDADRGCRVIMDEYDAARAITAKLLDAGHQRIGIIKGPREHLVSIRRFSGFANALGGRRLRVEPELVVIGDFSRESGRKLAPQLFRAKPTAIFASNDEMALGVLEAARAAGLSVPGDLSIAGFDGNSAAARSSPAISTIRQPLGAMGEAAFGLAVKSAASGRTLQQTEEIAFEVVEGGSIGQVASEDAVAAR